MQRLLEAIPSKEEWEKMSEEARELWFFTLKYLRKSHGLPKVGVDYHPAEIMALIAAKHPYLMDLVVEFDLSVDYDIE
jgi:hypothetical protein